MGVENKKAVKTDPGGKTPQLLADALPQSGSGSDLTALMLRFPHLTMFALYHAMSGCAIPELRSGFFTRLGKSELSNLNPTKKTGTPDSYLPALLVSLCV